MSERPPTSFDYCRNCGASLRADAMCCQNCGMSLSLSDAAFNPQPPVMDLYPTYMITLTSIIQAAALGYLLLAVQAQLSYIVTGGYDSLWTVLILAMFLIIVATWVQYGSAVLAARLVPTTVDALIPFCFGVTQALIIFSINMHQLTWFYFAFAANAIVGSSAYIWMTRRYELYSYRAENRIAFENAKPFIQNARRFSIIRIVIFFSFGVAEALLSLNSLLLAIIVLVMNVLQLVLVDQNTKKLWRPLPAD